MPARRRSSVDLPTPLGPVTPTQACGPAVNETSARTARPPRAWDTERATKVASDDGVERMTGTGDLRDRGTGRDAVDRVSLHVTSVPPPEGSAGKVGTDLTVEDGYRAARATGLSILATLAAELGSIDRIDRIGKVFGMVNVAPGFTRTPEVVDGCWDLLVEVFGGAGRQTRSAVGMAELPFDIPVEIELIARLRG